MTIRKTRKMFRCRFCHVRVAPFRKVGDEVVSGWKTLRGHVMNHHPQEYARIQRQLGDEPAAPGVLPG